MTLQELQRRLVALPSASRSDSERLFEAVLDLYENIRLDGTTVDDDGDMLLVQWGASDWGDGVYA